MCPPTDRPVPQPRCGIGADFRGGRAGAGRPGQLHAEASSSCWGPAQPDTVAALREQMGLDRPWPLRCHAAWLGGVLTGDLGHSFTYKTPVAGMILDRMQVSLPWR